MVLPIGFYCRFYFISFHLRAAQLAQRIGLTPNIEYERKILSPRKKKHTKPFFGGLNIFGTMCAPNTNCFSFGLKSFYVTQLSKTICTMRMQWRTEALWMGALFVWIIFGVIQTLLFLSEMFILYRQLNSV